MTGKRTCPEHGQTMVYGGIGAVRCPVPACPHFRRTTCGAFVRRVRPQGRTIVCASPVTSETYAVLPDGREVYHGGFCDRHPDRACYAGTERARIEHRRLA